MTRSLASFRPDHDVTEEDEGIEGFVPIFEGKILAFDQTLSHTGWALIQSPSWEVLHAGSIKPTSELTGHFENFDKAEQLQDAIDDLLHVWVPDAVVHEMPPVGGGRLKRADSTLLAALTVRLCARSYPRAMVAPRAAKLRITGDAGADKRELRDGLEALLPELVERARTLETYNEHVRDAIALAVLAAEKPEEFFR